MSGPPPPADLENRTPEIDTVPAGFELHRFHSARAPDGKLYDPIYFDRSRQGRLNAADGTFGVLYVAQKASGAFAETFLRIPGRTVLARDFVAGKAYARLRTTRALRFICLTGRGLARIGATAEVRHSGLPYDVPQAWSTALHGHKARADGIVYSARHDDQETCYAVFERARNTIEEVERRIDLDDDWFWDLAEAYGVGLAP